MAIRTSFVDPSYVPLVWPYVEHMVAKACDRGGNLISSEDIYKGCIEDEHHHRLMVIHNDDVLCGCISYRSVDDVLIQLSTTYGNIAQEDLPGLMLQMAALCRSTGAKRIVGVGRKGWRRYAPKYGWSPCEDGSFEYDLTVKE